MWPTILSREYSLWGSGNCVIPIFPGQDIHSWESRVQSGLIPTVADWNNAVWPSTCAAWHTCVTTHCGPRLAPPGTLASQHFVALDLRRVAPLGLLFIFLFVEEANLTTTDYWTRPQSVKNRNYIFLAINALRFYKLCSKDFLSL